jgi:hypothetical protein
MRAAFFLLTVLASTAAQAADDAALQAKVFGRSLGEKTGYACFTRLYTKDHLASHPRQNVTSIMLLVQGSGGGAPRYTAGVDFRFRKTAAHFQAFGSCPSLADEGNDAVANALHCGIECDGGTITVSLKDANTILVKLPDSIAVTGIGANDEPSTGRFGSDDKVFKLTRAPAPTCLPLALEDADKAALKAAK